MASAAIEVRDHDGLVEITLTVDDEKTVVMLDGPSARDLGDRVYKAGCNVGF